MPSNTFDSTEPLREPFAEYLTQFVTEHKLDVIERQLRLRTRHLTVALEDLHQAHNISACLRSCDGFGIQNVHVVEKRHRYRVNPNVERGSARWLTLIRHNEAENNSIACLKALRESGYRIVATSPRDDAVPLESFDPTQKSALFFGREKGGVSDDVLNAADVLLRIPMYGFAESFNVSVAAAICLHHLTWKLRDSDVDWQISDAERSALRFEWLKRVIGYRLPQLEREYQRRL